MQTQRTILWVIFLMSIFLLWDAWMRHTGGPGLLGPAPSTQSTPADGLDTSNPGAGASSDASVPTGGAPAAATDTPTAGGSAAASATAGTPAAGGQAAGAATVSLRNDVLDLAISTEGGVIVRGELLDHRDRINDGPIRLFANEPGNVFLAQSGVINAPQGTQFPTHRYTFSVAEETDSSVTLVAERDGLNVQRKYSLSPDSYIVEIADTLKNTGDAPLSPVVYRQLTRDANVPPGDDSFYITTFVGPVIYTDKDKLQKIDFDDVADKSAQHARQAPDGWAGIMQHYFATAMIPADGSPREYYTLAAGNGLYSVGIKEAVPALAPGESATNTVRLFTGPQEQKRLETIAPGLDLMVDYGFLTILCKPLWWLLDTLHSYVGNWGWAIVLLTLIIKTIFFPLQAASYKSMARMKAVAPRLQAMRERFGDDRVKMNQAMMDLYKNEKINPLGGCLPILVQIPVFIALYWVLLASVEMRDAPWIGWITDLASPDPYYILPLLMAISMFIQVRLNPTPPDPVQAKVMMIMPVAFSVFFFFFPAGLVLYWLVNNIYSIIQQWVITRKIVPPAPPAPAST